MPFYVHMAGMAEVLEIDSGNESDIVRQFASAIAAGQTLTFGIPGGQVMRQRIVNLSLIAYVEVTQQQPPNETKLIHYAMPSAANQIF